jgi:bifunctional NMN adenylyltransferase/nudix hydrolase
LLTQPLDDYVYNLTAWIADVQRLVSQVQGSFPKPSGLVGYSKDKSSYYLKLFPGMKSVSIGAQWGAVNSTNLREAYLQPSPGIPDEVVAPKAVIEFLRKFYTTPEFKWLLGEQQFYERYRRKWTTSPYPPFICTVDPVVVQSGHILLVRRKERPGKGLWALPGGHVNPDETFRDAVVRELKEETRISDDRGEIPEGRLATWIEKTQLFDAPHRSLRGRVVTQAYLFKLPERTALFDVVGDDDAESAQWHPLGDIPANRFHDDHYHIIREMTGV